MSSSHSGCGLGQLRPGLAQEFGTRLFDKFKEDESAQRQALRQDLAHRRRKPVATIAGAYVIVSGDQATDRHTREVIEQREHLAKTPRPTVITAAIGVI